MAITMGINVKSEGCTTVIPPGVRSLRSGAAAAAEAEAIIPIIPVVGGIRKRIDLSGKQHSLEPMVVTTTTRRRISLQAFI